MRAKSGALRRELSSDHAEQRHCDVLEIVAPFMMILKKERRDLSTLMVSSSLCWKVKTRMLFGSGAAVMVLQLRTNTVSEREQDT